MVNVGDEAPDFTAPMAGGAAYDDIERFTLSEAVESGPVVLAFVPAAFTRGCTAELCSFHESLSSFEALDARVYGVSVDLPFSQNVWLAEEEINVPMLSDWDHLIIRQYDVVREDVRGILETAERSVFVVEADGRVTYRWVRDGENPDFEALVADVRAAVEEAADR